VSRIFGLIFMIVGVIGLVISVLLIPAVWVGRAAVDDQVTALTASVREPLQQADDSAGQVSSRIGTIRGALGQVANLTQTGTGSTGGLEKGLSQRLLSLIDDTIGPAYQQLRDAYISMKERLSQTSRAVAVLQRVVPQVSLPALPTDDLASLDSQIQELDANLRQMRSDLTAGILPDNVPGVDTLRKIDDGVQKVDAGFAGMVQRVDNIQARVAMLRNQVDQAEAAFDRVSIIVAAVLSLFCLYLGLLHLVLFAYGRQLRETSTAPPVVNPVPETVPPPTPPAPTAAAPTT
jgi:hypothetical protein